MAYDYDPYVPVAKRRANAQKVIHKLRKQGVEVCPIAVQGRKIAHTFWGEAWCNHLERFSDYANRLPRGKTYVRNGSVCHLEINKGTVKALVSGSRVYQVRIGISPLEKPVWNMVQKNCMGQIGSLLELLEGKLSDQVMEVVTHPQTGLFPQTREMRLDCNCPDYATLCKHIAAVFYGIGALLDKQPELLFKLRGVNQDELISPDMEMPAGSGKRRRLDSNVGEMFGIELDRDTGPDGSAPVPADRSTHRDKATETPPARRHTKPAKRKTPFNPTPENILRLRQQLGLNPTQFARLLDVSVSSVSLWERKGGRVNLQKKSRLALMDAAKMDKRSVRKKLG
ncbi:MAG: SWIM zinc finger family protein [Gammaproteobacteria bacterium]|nr:SWIM zinc finger family protein [Gammaproteobacteria bacterium]